MRPTLALLLDNLFDGYQEIIWQAAREAARARDVNLFSFVGGAFSPRVGGGELAGKNLIYELVPRFRPDGLLLVNGALGYHVSDAELSARLAEISSTVPRASVSRPIPGVPTVVVDNRRGMRDLVGHLLDVHGRRHVAFVSGPAASEGDARLLGYRDALEARGLRFDSALVVPGDFSRESGVRAVGELLARGVEFDALAAANDYMALYAIRELQARGFRVPKDLSVVGFDDIADAVSAIPSLTTAAQPVREMVFLAVDLLLRQLEGAQVESVVEAPVRFVPRRSCGCNLEVGAEDDGAVELRTLAEVLEATAPFLRGEEGGKRRSEVLGGDMLAALATKDARIRLIDRLRDWMAQDMARQGSAVPWLAAVRQAFAWLRRSTSDVVRSQADAVWVESFAAVTRAVEEAEAGARVRSQEEFKSVQRLFFPTDVTEDEVRRVLLGQLPTLGVRSFYLSRFVGEGRAQARLSAHYGPADRVAIESAEDPFDAGRLVPGRFSADHRHGFAVLPVYSREDQLGFAVVEMTDLPGSAYEALMNHVSTAVRVSSLLRTARDYAEELERKVEERTHELAGAQRQLLDAARHGGMAEIAVGVLHNIGNLVTSVSVSAGEIGTRMGARDREVEGLRRTASLLAEQGTDLAAFFTSDARASHVAPYLEKLAATFAGTQETIRGEVAGLQGQVKLIRETIRALQSYAREGDELVRAEPLDLGEVVETALRVQANLLDRFSIRVERDWGRLPELCSQRSRILHVVVNVVKNAVEAMRTVPHERRRLTISGGPGDGGGAWLVVADQGEGIAPEDLPQVFNYGFTTKPDGNGFGLHASANLMRQLGGEIGIESEGRERGARVRLRFPPGE